MSSELEDRLRQAAEILPFPDEEATRGAHERARAAVRRPRHHRLPSGHDIRRFRWAAATAAAVALASGLAVGVGAWTTREESTKTSLVGLGFLPAKGWMVVQSGVGQSGSASAVAANVPLRADNDVEAAVRATRASLPARGVLMVVRFTTRGDPAADVGFMRRDLPLSLESGLASFSGKQRVYRIRAGVGSYNLDARIYFGSASPAGETLEVAQRQLNRLVVAADGVTLVLRPRIIRDINERLSIFGAVSSGKANEKVTIQFKQCGLRPPQFRDFLETTTQEGGGYSFAELRPFTPRISGVFRAVWRDSVSPEVSVQARAFVSLRVEPGGRFQVYVGAQAPTWRRKVLLQRYERARGIWITLRSLLLTEQLGGGNSPMATTRTAKFRPAVPRGTAIRAVFPLSAARPCYLAGYSPTRRT